MVFGARWPRVASPSTTGGLRWMPGVVWASPAMPCLACYAMPGLLERVWELRENLSAYDAGYVALAEALRCSLVTADARISRASGVRCPVTVVPR